MKFEFAKYTEITDLALSMRPDYKESGYVRFFTDLLDDGFGIIDRKPINTV